MKDVPTTVSIANAFNFEQPGITASCRIYCALIYIEPYGTKKGEITLPSKEVYSLNDFDYNSVIGPLRANTFLTWFFVDATSFTSGRFSGGVFMTDPREFSADYPIFESRPDLSYREFHTNFYGHNRQYAVRADLSYKNFPKIHGRINMTDDVDVIEFEPVEDHICEFTNTGQAVINAELYCEDDPNNPVDAKYPMYPGDKLSTLFRQGKKYYLKLYNYWGIGTYELTVDRNTDVTLIAEPQEVVFDHQENKDGKPHYYIFDDHPEHIRTCDVLDPGSGVAPTDFFFYY